jgi:zinc transport system substrate-binding protein
MVIEMRFCLALLALPLLSSTALAEVKVLASIKPLHSLVAQVMQGVGEPGLIVDGANSPHTYTLKPSQAHDLQNAEIIFWIGHELEPFLEKPISTLGDKAKAVAMIDDKNIRLLPQRTDHHHDDSEHDHEDGGDPHLWLSPTNAKAMIRAIAQTLDKADPMNAAAYAKNANTAVAKLDSLESELRSNLQNLNTEKYIVFHDAYQYFETSFSLAGGEAINIHPENPPGAKAITAMREDIASGKIKCVFSEPQFDSKLVDTITENLPVKTGVLDPLGASLPPGPQLYEELIRKLAQSFAGCLGH